MKTIGRRGRNRVHAIRELTIRIGPFEVVMRIGVNYHSVDGCSSEWVPPSSGHANG